MQPEEKIRGFGFLGRHFSIGKEYDKKPDRQKISFPVSSIQADGIVQIPVSGYNRIRENEVNSNQKK
jgi:hypothetical protein